MTIPQSTIDQMIAIAQAAGYVATSTSASTADNFVVTIMVRNKTEAERKAGN